jgi:hypothetical protein
MWLLSLTAFFLAFLIWFNNRKVEPPTVGFVAALLFSLPAIRQTQPGIPSIGCNIDVVGFLWNMFLVLCASLLLMWNYILSHPKIEPKDNQHNSELTAVNPDFRFKDLPGSPFASSPARTRPY